MSERVTGEAFAQLFRTFTRSAWRLESRSAYLVAEEQQPLRRYLNEGVLETDFLQGWLDDVRAATSAGRQFGRVRVLTDPLSDYLRWEMTVAGLNREAGEDIRVLSGAQAAELGLPDHDFWLFDDERLARMHFTDDGAPLGAEMIADPGTVSRYRQWQEMALAHAVPFTEHPQTVAI